jgi:cell wall assembly regulator SMI1
MAAKQLMTIRETWDVIHDWLDGHALALRNKLKKPANAAAVQKLEKLIGLELPGDFKASYQIHNGCFPGSGLLIGVPWMSLEAIAKEWQFLNPPDARQGQRSSSGGVSFWDGMVNEEPDLAKWIPFAGPDEQNYIGLDFDPGPKGTVGQVINFGADQQIYGTPLYVLAPTFRGFMHFFAEQLATDQVELADNSEDYLQTTMRPKEGHSCNLLTGLALFFQD